MPRITGGAKQAQKRKRTLKRAKGYVGSRSKLYRTAKDAVRRAGQYAWEHRRQKKRTFRRLWIVRINAACRQHGVRYSEFIAGLEAAGVTLNRKMLSEIAIADPATFEAIVKQVREHIPSPQKTAA